MAAQLFWVNRGEPYFVGSMQVASSGKVAAVYTPTTGNIGKPMRVNFRGATVSEIQTWEGYIGQSFTILGQTVIFAFENPLAYQNEVFGDEADIGSTYGGSLDLYRGTMNLIIVG